MNSPRASNSTKTKAAQVDLKEVIEEETALDEVRQETEHAQQNQLPDLGEHYEVLSLVGSGGMGSVYRVRDRQTGENFAVKVIADNLLNDPVALKRFETEVMASQKLDHPNLVSVYGSGKSPAGTPFILMELLEGQSLAQSLEKERFFDSHKALDIFTQLAAGLEFAHKDGVIHRDIKPTNVILSHGSDGVEIPKLVDFGIATMMPAADRNTRDLTQTREVFGSPHYMSPEQCLGFMLDQRSDIYSLGCLMYEVLTGKPPFAGENPVQVVVNHINEEAQPFPRELKGTKRLVGLQNVILRCLEKQPERRYQTMAELLQDLRLLEADKSVPAYHKGKAKRRYTSNQIICAVSIVALLLVSSTYGGFYPLISWEVTRAIQTGTILIAAAGGIYAAVSTFINKLKVMTRANNGTCRQWMSIFFLGFVSLFALALVPELVHRCYQAGPSSGGVVSLVACSVSVLFGVVSMMGYAIFRGEKKIGPWQAGVRLLVLSLVLSSAFVVVAPRQASGVSQWFADRLTEQSLGKGEKTVNFDLPIMLFKLSDLLDKESNSSLSIANLLNAEGKHKESIDLLTHEIENNKLNFAAYNDRALRLIQIGELKKADDDLTWVVTHEDANKQGTYYYRSSETYALRGKIRGLLGQLNLALADYDKAILLSPDYKNPAYAYRVGTYWAAGLKDNALAELDKLCAIVAPRSESHLFNFVSKGILLQNLGRTKEAKQAFETALEHFDGNATNFNDYGVYEVGQCNSLLGAYAAKQAGKDQLYRDLMKTHNDDQNCRQKPSTLLNALNLEDSNLKTFW